MARPEPHNFWGWTHDHLEVTVMATVVSADPGYISWKIVEAPALKLKAVAWPRSDAVSTPSLRSLAGMKRWVLRFREAVAYNGPLAPGLMRCNLPRFQLCSRHRVMRALVYAAAIAVFGAFPAQAAEVIVEEGETLTHIAARELGDGSRWGEICSRNADLLKATCDLLPIGITLSIPEATEAAAPQTSLTTEVASPPESVAVATDTPSVFAIPAEGFTVSDAGPNIVATTVAGLSQHRVRYGFNSEGRDRVSIEWLLQTTANSALVVFTPQREAIGTISFDGSSGITVEGAISNAHFKAGDGLGELSFDLSLSPEEGLVQLLYYPIGIGAFEMRKGVQIHYQQPSVL